MRGCRAERSAGNEPIWHARRWRATGLKKRQRHKPCVLSLDDPAPLLASRSATYCADNEAIPNSQGRATAAAQSAGPSPATPRKRAFEFPVLSDYSWAICGRPERLTRVAHRVGRAFVASDARPPRWTTLHCLQGRQWHSHTHCDKGDLVWNLRVAALIGRNRLDKPHGPVRHSQILRTRRKFKHPFFFAQAPRARHPQGTRHPLMQSLGSAATR